MAKSNLAPRGPDPGDRPGTLRGVKGGSAAQGPLELEAEAVADMAAILDEVAAAADLAAMVRRMEVSSRELVESYNDAVMRFDGDAWAANWTDDGESTALKATIELDVAELSQSEYDRSVQEYKAAAGREPWVL